MNNYQSISHWGMFEIPLANKLYTAAYIAAIGMGKDLQNISWKSKNKLPFKHTYNSVEF